MESANTPGSPGATPSHRHSPLDSSFPVFLPYNKSIFLPEDQFQDYVRKVVADARNPQPNELMDEVTDAQAVNAERPNLAPDKAPFIQGLEKHEAHLRTREDLAAENKTLTENADVTHISSQNPLVDLFYDMGENTAPMQLKRLLDNAWAEDPLMTLKIIFNARSIHLGKSNRTVLYRAMGWLAENHPVTLLSNLKWLVRPVIEKKPTKAENIETKEAGDAKKKSEAPKSEDEDFDMVDADEGRPTDPSRAHDVRFGVSHGYWKDLLNLVMFAAHDQLKLDGDLASLLTPENSKQKKHDKVWDQQAAKELRHKKREDHHKRVVEKLGNDGFYCALHLTVARLFAEQLKDDKRLTLLNKKSEQRNLSLAAKWVPTHGGSHDKNTFILSSIVEILYPDPKAQATTFLAPYSTPFDPTDRDMYLRHAREKYRSKYGATLRKALAIVERDIAANKFENINYELVPSLAMDRYSGLFMRKDFEHFQGYVKKVASGSAKISGATLLPSTLIKKALEVSHCDPKKIKNFAAVKSSVEAEVTGQVIDGQWKTLVQRVKDSGALDASIAVCDVSRSMTMSMHADETQPIHSAIGLSLLVSEVTAPPFGGGFITFSAMPQYASVGGPEDKRDLITQVERVMSADYGMSTNMVAVFEELILPMAVNNNLKQEDMVKQVYVFSDMQFDQAENGVERWSSAYERIKQKYAAAGYDMPRLVFWNLAARSTSKPVTTDDTNTSLVSGYSQGMLKVFLDGGGFEAEGEDEILEEIIGEEGMTEVTVKKKVDPMTLVRKAVSHKAYSMLEVVD
ncbi:hypothetical protein P280DRAFT_548352 [Massarina eburnea CBS 473.64]|uniref:Uncharacterized protein n=1 Tax=Massarina eburnea CBS 473.64 TaxID=1395130 RepID=A0A6A6S2B8_9PLEO|nr:hypothetical protein P280DRAFT_548352 [Massarina eburnea CBS 473.64]